LAAGKPATGLQRYTSGLLTALAQCLQKENLHLILYFNSPVPPDAYAPGKPLSVLLPSPGQITWRVAPHALRRGWMRLGMGLAMLVDRLHAFHFPAPLMAGFCPRPAVVTFHDLAALSLGGDLTEKEAAYLPDARRAARRARRLIAVSNSARNELARHFSRADAITIPEGVDALQFRPATPRALAATRQWYGLDRYILCVGTLQARKNHLRLITAFGALQSEIPHTLVIAGGDGSGAEDVRDLLASRPELRVKLIGYVDDAALPALYSGAEAFVLPSLWEGFGLPILEAMACGVPVITSNRSALAEVAGDAALLVDPEDENAIAAALRDLLGESPATAMLRERLIAAGFGRAEQYSWAEAARKTLAVYRALGQHR
jgi:glycosyltransferase involved in cell wall biosynthesis